MNAAAVAAATKLPIQTGSLIDFVAECRRLTNDSPLNWVTDF